MTPGDTIRLTVDLSQPTGPLRYGASGALYGLGNAGIPSAHALAPIRPQVAAQKPEGGLQHPNGDALDVAATFHAAGGREIEIYMQDIYARWPYEQLGLDDYLEKVGQIVRAALDSPHRAMFSYVPFNEPDAIWYNTEDRRQALLDDWRAVFCHIRLLDPYAKIVGPNFANYHSAFYREFLAFCKENDCLPNVISWHELNDGFFSGWRQRYAEYRQFERELGIAPLELCINEYARIKGDLGVPGKLIQWVARFEESKVDACLAYWTDAGSFDNLLARDSATQATGGWWLYKWYGDMAGTTVAVAAPNPDAEGLSGLAALDAAGRRARVLLGGADGAAEVLLRGLDAAPWLGRSARVAVWEAADSGLAPSPGPALLREDVLPIEGGELRIPMVGMRATSAYQIVLAPGDEEIAPYAPGRYRPERAGGCSFVVTAGDDCTHRVVVRYEAPTASAAQLRLNGQPLAHLDLPAAGRARWAELALDVFLTAGVNQIELAGEAPLNIAWVELAPAAPPQRYEAEAEANALSGGAERVDDGAASGGAYVGGLGGGALEFTGVQAPAEGLYRMAVRYANAEHRGAHDYNVQVVDRPAEIRVNGGAAQIVRFRNTFAWDCYRTRVVDVWLRAGENRIRFGGSAPAPHIDSIAIAPAIRMGATNE